MLRDRILTALILIPLVVCGILFLPAIWLALIFGLLTLLSAWEWAALSGIISIPAKIAYLLLFLPPLLLLHYSPDLFPPAVLVLGVVSAAWCLIAVWLFAIRRPLPRDVGWSVIKMMTGFVVLISAWWSVITIHDSGASGPELLLFLMILIWGADSGAYFAGKRWGKRKLAPLVSPGKSLEGALGAFAVALLCGVVLGFWQSGIGFGLAIALCVGVTFISIVGDLFESLMKRRAGLKDSGNILPGHGGILDRIDSLTAAAPVYLFSLISLGVI